MCFTTIDVTYNFLWGSYLHTVDKALVIAEVELNKWPTWTTSMKRQALYHIVYCTCLLLLLLRGMWWEDNMGWGMIGSDSSSKCNTFKLCNSLKMHILHQLCSCTKLLTGLFNGDQGTQFSHTPRDIFRTWRYICTKQISLHDCDTE